MAPSTRRSNKEKADEDNTGSQQHQSAQQPTPQPNWSQQQPGYGAYFSPGWQNQMPPMYMGPGGQHQQYPHGMSYGGPGFGQPMHQPPIHAPTAPAPDPRYNEASRKEMVSARKQLAKDGDYMYVEHDEWVKKRSSNQNAFNHAWTIEFTDLGAPAPSKCESCSSSGDACLTYKPGACPRDGGACSRCKYNGNSCSLARTSTPVKTPASKRQAAEMASSPSAQPSPTLTTRAAFQPTAAMSERQRQASDSLASLETVKTMMENMFQKVCDLERGQKSQYKAVMASQREIAELVESQSTMHTKVLSVGQQVNSVMISLGEWKSRKTSATMEEVKHHLEVINKEVKELRTEVGSQRGMSATPALTSSTSPALAQGLGFNLPRQPTSHVPGYTNVGDMMARRDRESSSHSSAHSAKHNQAPNDDDEDEADDTVDQRIDKISP